MRFRRDRVARVSKVDQTITSRLGGDSLSVSPHALLISSRRLFSPVALLGVTRHRHKSTFAVHPNVLIPLTADVGITLASHFSVAIPNACEGIPQYSTVPTIDVRDDGGARITAIEQSKDKCSFRESGEETCKRGSHFQI